jgi:hypothetical protein
VKELRSECVNNNYELSSSSSSSSAYDLIRKELLVECFSKNNNFNWKKIFFKEFYDEMSSIPFLVK